MEKEGGGGGGDAGAQALTHRPGWAQNSSNSSSQAPSRVPFPFRKGAGCGQGGAFLDPRGGPGSRQLFSDSRKPQLSYTGVEVIIF